MKGHENETITWLNIKAFYACPRGIRDGIYCYLWRKWSKKVPNANEEEKSPLKVRKVHE